LFCRTANHGEHGEHGEHGDKTGTVSLIARAVSDGNPKKSKLFAVPAVSPWFDL
jgi:hypothetical protein